MPGRMVTYSIGHGRDEIILKVAYVNSVIPCGSRSNIELTYNIWTTLDYYCSNYATVVLPSANSVDNIEYVLHYLAEMVGGTTRRCGRCVYLLDDSRHYSDLGCKKPENFRSVLCCMLPPLLKSAASEIVFGLCSKEKLRFDLVSS